MAITKSDEQVFEALIEKALVGSSREERGNANVDGQTPTADQFYWGLPSDMNKKQAIDTRRLWSFLQSSQSDELAKYKGADVQNVVQNRISKEIETVGLIEVLRKGIKVENIHLSLFYPCPSRNDSEISHQKYAKNQFSVTRQQTFSQINAGWEIDMVVYVNGLPIFTIELKKQSKGQTARVDGQNQYKSAERNPKDTLLSFGRCLAHFTFDEEEVYFTTRLDGKDTYFMPFNKGLPNGQGAGNPVNPFGFKTSYMWEHILTKTTISNIIQNYVLFDYGEAKTGKKVPHILKNAKALIFPRYHQLDVVDKLAKEVSTVGVGKTYLIQHSAGSGKSNSITWLAFKLIKECPVSMTANRAKAIDEPLYNSVIIVTDRRILDRQIKGNILAFSESSKIYEHADTSKQLKNAIESGKRIIITTIQKFPYISQEIGNVNDRNFAIIIDEAHSSQSGSAADEMNTTVQRDEDSKGEDTDSILMKIAKSRKMSTNTSYFAFTATPKKETLERFGYKDENGKYHPYHLYSMKQAIDEEFILDVLANYTTYKSYYELVKAIESNPEYAKQKAQRLLKTAVERNPQTIRAKAEIMLTHFDTNVFRPHLLKGKAKAMVLTQDIECAIRYYYALCEVKKEKKLPYGILVAFSDEHNYNGEILTEAKINGFPESNLPEEFDKDENRILVVANKYLTGFDQKKLSAMYIDKKLEDVLAVQSLSRLNRSAKELGKRAEDLFVLDFFNTKEDMKESFDPFYTSTLLDHATDVNVLHDLRTTLLNFEVFSEEEIEDFIEKYVKNDGWEPIIQTIAHRFNFEIEWEENGKADFKIKCKQFVKVYSRMAAIINYENLEWEKLFWLLKELIPYLVVTGTDDTDIRELLKKVDLTTYGLRRTALKERIILDAGETVLDPNETKMAGAGGEPERDNLEAIIKEFNERWFSGWATTPEDQKTKLIKIAEAVVKDKSYNDLVVGNPDNEAVERAMKEIIDRIIRQQRKADMSLYKEYQQNEGFKDNFRILVNRMISENLYATR